MRSAGEASSITQALPREQAAIRHCRFNQARSVPALLLSLKAGVAARPQVLIVLVFFTDFTG
jgi:hypothetical protein